MAKEGILQDLLQFDSKSIPENHLVLHVNTEGLKRYGALLYIQKLYQQSLSFKLVPKQVVSSKEVSQTQIESAFEEKPVTIDQGKL